MNIYLIIKYFLLQNDIEQYLNYVKGLKSEFKKMQKIALHWTRGVSPYDTQLFKSFSEKFAKIEQNDIDDMDTYIIEIKSQLNILNVDPNAPWVYCIYMLTFCRK